MTATGTTDPVKHYNYVADAWRYLLGEDLHYGYFENPDAPLPEATAALTGLMLRHADLGVEVPRGRVAVVRIAAFPAARVGHSTSRSLMSCAIFWKMAWRSAEVGAM